MTSRQEVEQEIEETLGRVPSWTKEAPDETLPHYWGQMRDLQVAETEIPGKYKELIGLAVSGATRCKYCTLFHTEAAKLKGATPEEISEASAMGALTMGLSTFLNAMQVDYDTFRKETKEIVAYLKEQKQKEGRQEEAVVGRAS